MLSPFTDAMLLSVDGVDHNLLSCLRGMPQSVDAAACGATVKSCG
jgi:hypothetical protein